MRNIYRPVRTDSLCCRDSIWQPCLLTQLNVQRLFRVLFALSSQVMKVENAIALIGRVGPHNTNMLSGHRSPRPILQNILWTYGKRTCDEVSLYVHNILGINQVILQSTYRFTCMSSKSMKSLFFYLVTFHQTWCITSLYFLLDT